MVELRGAMDYAASKFILKRDARVTLYAYYWSDLVEGRRLQPHQRRWFEYIRCDSSARKPPVYPRGHRIAELPTAGVVQQSLGFIDKEEESSVRNHLRQRIPTTSPHEVTTPACSVLPRKEELRRRLVRRMMAVVIVGDPLLIAAEAAGQALFSRDAPKEPGARSWALERAKLAPFDPPRTKDGRPDLTGRWAGTPGGDDVEEHDYVDISSPPEESFVSDPPDGKIPTSRGRWQGEPSIGQGWRAGGRARAVNACMQTRRRFVSTPSRARPIAAGSRYSRALVTCS